MGTPKFLRYSIRRALSNVTLGPSGGQVYPPDNLPLWALDYDGISAYGQLTNPWQPTGADWNIRVTQYYEGNATSTYGILADSALADSKLYALDTRLVIDVRSFAGSQGFGEAGITASPAIYETTVSALDGTLANNELIVASGLSLPSISVDLVGVLRGLNNFYNGQIHRIELIDNDTPSNSIVINNLIASETQPTDFNIYNELTGAVIGQYYNGVYELARGI